MKAEEIKIKKIITFLKIIKIKPKIKIKTISRQSTKPKISLLKRVITLTNSFGKTDPNWERERERNGTKKQYQEWKERYNYTCSKSRLKNNCIFGQHHGNKC